MTAPAQPLPRRERAAAGHRGAGRTALDDLDIAETLVDSPTVDPRPLDVPVRRPGSRRPSSTARRMAVRRAAVRSNAPRGPFVVLLLVLMGSGLLSLLLLNTALMENAFHADELESRAAALAEEEQRLSVQLDRESDPGQLAARAGQLGMVSGGVPEYLPAGAELPPGARVLTREPDDGVLVVIVPEQVTQTAEGTAAQTGEQPAGVDGSTEQPPGTVAAAVGGGDGAGR